MPMPAARARTPNESAKRSSRDTDRSDHPGAFEKPGAHAGSGVTTPRAIRSGVIDAQSEKSTAPEPAISQRVVVNEPVEITGGAEQQRRDGAEHVADPEHQAGHRGDVGGPLADVDGQRHYQREHRARGETDHRGPCPGAAGRTTKPATARARAALNETR